METGKPLSLMWGVSPPGKLDFFLQNIIDLSFCRLKRDLQVTTGTFGILEYPDAHQRSTSIFLSIERTSPYVPAPKLFWTVVLDPVTGQSAAFMGLNDPHATVAPKNICKNRFVKTFIEQKWTFPGATRWVLGCTLTLMTWIPDTSTAALCLTRTEQ